MWLAFYNPETLGDVLLLTSGKAQHIKTMTKDKMTLIFDKDTNKLVSMNLFGMADTLGLAGNGQLHLTDTQVKQLNHYFKDNDVDVTLHTESKPVFIAGYVEECEPVEGSDYLSKLMVDIGEEDVQIVCGAANIDEDMTVLVALPGAVMPNGSIIWPGELRGVKSEGMVCSTRELNLTHIDDAPGIWELNDDFEPGTPLSEIIESY